MDPNTPISSIAMGTKPAKALSALGVETVGDLLDLKLSRVPELPGMGRGTADKLLAVKRRLTVGGNPAAVPLELAWPCLLDGLGTRTRKALKAVGVSGPDDLADLEMYRFMRVGKAGRRSWKEALRLREELARYCAASASRSELDAAWADGVAGFDPRIQSKLLELSVMTVEDLQMLTKEQFCNVRSIEQDSWQQVRDLKHQLGPLFWKGRKPTWHALPLFDGAGVTDPQDVPDEFLPDVPMEDVIVPRILLPQLCARNVATLGQLLTASQEELGVTPLQYRHLREAVERFWDQAKTPAEPATGDDLSSFLKVTIAPAKVDKVALKVFYSRLGLGRKFKTLAKLARKLGCTREAVRRRSMSVLEKAECHYEPKLALQSLRKLVLKILEENGGRLPAEQLSELLSGAMGWQKVESGAVVGRILMLLFRNSDPIRARGRFVYLRSLPCDGGD